MDASIEALSAILPEFRSHKVVRAGKIVSVTRNTSTFPQYEPDAAGEVAIAVGSVGLVWHQSCSAAMFARFVPQQGDYLVIYEDGYMSFSPAKAFEDGYSEMAALAGSDFGSALRALKSGLKIARAGWNGKGMWLSLSGPLDGRRIHHSAFWSTNNADYAQEQPLGHANVLPCITMKTADGSILMGWLASQTDMLAEDWEIVP